MGLRIISIRFHLHINPPRLIPARLRRHGPNPKLIPHNPSNLQIHARNHLFLFFTHHGNLHSHGHSSRRRIRLRRRLETNPTLHPTRQRPSNKTKLKNGHNFQKSLQSHASHLFYNLSSLPSYRLLYNNAHKFLRILCRNSNSS